MSGTHSQSATTYATYLQIPELLSLQQPRASGPEHDELLFIVIHQTYELWFKTLLHELSRAAELLQVGRSHDAVATLGRIRTIFKTLVSQVDILETMTPLQFGTFRDRLDAASGFQSAQFRELEIVLGQRDDAVLARFFCLVLPSMIGFPGHSPVPTLAPHADLSGVPIEFQRA